MPLASSPDEPDPEATPAELQNETGSGPVAPGLTVPVDAVPVEDPLPVAPPASGSHGPSPAGRLKPVRVLLALGVVLLCAVVAIGSGIGRGLHLDAAQPEARALSTGATQGQAAPRRTQQNQVMDRRVALSALLDQRAAAVLHHDKGGWLASVDPVAAPFRSQQSRVFDRLRLLPLAAWHYQVMQDEPVLAQARQRLLGPTAWVSTIELFYRFQADRVSIRRIEHLTARRVGSRWLIAADTDGATDRDLWDLAPITVRTGTRSVLVGVSTQARSLGKFARDVDVAARNVDKVWGTEWPRTVVLLVPDSVSQMAKLLGRSNTAGLGQLAAVTTGEVRQAGDVLARPAGTADRVVLNPQAFGTEFGEAGRRLVLTHELVHVATRSAAWCSPPIWVEEGFADFVAYRSSGLSRERIASELVAAVKLGRAPAHLPSVDDFDPARSPVAEAYAGAWLAFDMIARAGGEKQAVDFYRAVAGIDRHGRPPAKAPQVLEQAYQDVLGVDGVSFEKQWRSYVAAVAGKPSG